VLVVGESLVSLTLTALATGLVFAKFSRPSARVLFSREAVVRQANDVPTLMVRVGNQRGNRIVDVHISATLTRTEHLREGELFYRTYDVELARPRALSLSRSWTLMHVIDARSPLHGCTPEALARDEAELHVMLVGLDDTSMQTMYASHTYYARDILWGARHADILSELEDGTMVVDLSKFHDTEPMSPSEGFPYPRKD
jgi:inward rectifier potassium channel